jgi:hypothetical protein
MASFSLKRPDRFPEGTSVKAYPKANWPASVYPSGAPLGSETETAVVDSNDIAAFSALSTTSYYAHAQVSGEHRYVGFTVPGASGVTVEISNVTGLQDALDDKADEADVTAGLADKAASTDPRFPTTAEKALITGLPKSTTGQYGAFWKPAAYYRESLPIDRSLSNISMLTSGTPYLTPIYFYAGEVITTVTFVAGSTPGATLTHQWAAVLSSARAVLATSNNDTTAAWAAEDPKTFTFGSPYTVLADGFHYIALMVAATTPPTLRGAAWGTALDSMRPMLTGRSSTSGLTTPSALATVYNAPNASLGSCPWIGVA